MDIARPTRLTQLGHHGPFQDVDLSRYAAVSRRGYEAADFIGVLGGPQERGRQSSRFHALALSKPTLARTHRIRAGIA
jgi:hypothetical protein